MEHKVADFSKLLEEGSVKGLSPKMIKAHLGLYEGYVKKLNEIQQKLGELRAQLDKDPEALQKNANFSFGLFSELKRREIVAFNGSYLHKAYFENLEPVAEADDQFKAAVKAGFGSMEKWLAETKADAASTPGWVLVTVDHVSGKLHNWPIHEHSINVPAISQDVVLALDCWEHAYAIDYGTDKASYVKAFLQNINWEEVNARLRAVLKGKASTAMR
jgi:Fe-Mn family superoxide dismutase